LNTRPAPDGACAAAPSGIDAASTVQALLGEAALPRTEARRLLAATLGVPIETLIAGPERRVEADARARFDSLCARRRGENRSPTCSARRSSTAGASRYRRPCWCRGRDGTPGRTRASASRALPRAPHTRPRHRLGLRRHHAGTGASRRQRARRGPVRRCAGHRARQRQPARPDVEFLASDWFDAIRGRSTSSSPTLRTSPAMTPSGGPAARAAPGARRRCRRPDDLRRSWRRRRRTWSALAGSSSSMVTSRTVRAPICSAMPHSPNIETHRDLAGIERVDLRHVDRHRRMKRNPRTLRGSTVSTPIRQDRARFDASRGDSYTAPLSDDPRNPIAMDAKEFIHKTVSEHRSCSS